MQYQTQNEGRGWVSRGDVLFLDPFPIMCAPKNNKSTAPNPLGVKYQHQVRILQKSSNPDIKQDEGYVLILFQSFPFSIIGHGMLIFVRPFRGVSRVEKRMDIASHAGTSGCRQGRIVPRESGP